MLPARTLSKPAISTIRHFLKLAKVIFRALKLDVMTALYMIKLSMRLGDKSKLVKLSHVNFV